MPAFDYYQEEAVVKLIEGDWKWQDHFTLGKQLEKIAANLTGRSDSNPSTILNDF